ncbi:centromere protein C isoform X1 [Canis lupus familiaris]|uniref:Centromere protein C n=1 Tax=Canis lupus familiaris TaxID=9615 RepID=A0A8I3N2E4_CANLF|nr:centromere protein C isoform X1 [Canis lupus familiaris]
MAAASGLDHLKNEYRRRFCRPSRAPAINTKEGQNILEILQDCFEEKSFANDFSTNSTKSVLFSTPKVGDICIQSPSKEAQCQKSHLKSVPVSSRKKESEGVNRSAQDHEVHQQILATVGSKNTPGLRRTSSKKLRDHHSEASEKFHLSVGSPVVLLDAKASVLQNAVPSVAQKRETYTSENSVNTLPSSTEISLKTRKRLNFEEKSVLKKEIANKVSEIEDKVSEETQKRRSLRISQKRVQDSEDEIQPQTKKSFSTLFLETVKRKSESSPVVRHIATAPPHSSPSNDLTLLEDEFIIDESESSIASQPWITIPRKAGSLKQCTVYPAESSALLQSKKSKEKHHSLSPTALTSDKHSDTAYAVETSPPSEQRRLGRSCASTNELENDYRSTKHEMYYENAEKSSGKKKTIQQQERGKFKANILEEQVDMEQSKDNNINVSHITQDKLQRNSDRNMEECEKVINVGISKKQMLPVGSKKNSTNVPYTVYQKKDKKSKKKHFPSGSKKNKLIPDEVTSTITRSRRISRHPSDWWVVKSEQSHVYSNSPRRNELSLSYDCRQKLAEKPNQSSKNTKEKTTPFKERKITTSGSSGAQEFLNAKDSGRVTDHDEISGCCQNESLESDEEDLVTKKNHSGGIGNPKKKDNMTAQNVHLKSQIKEFTCKTPAESNLDSGEPKTSVLEGSGPFRVKNYLTSGKNNSDVDDREVSESSILPSNTPNVRRTKRTRLKPLEYWRGERIDYHGRPSGGFVIGGILSPDTVSSKTKSKGNVGKVKKMANRKRICLDDEERKKKFMVNLNIYLWEIRCSQQGSRTQKQERLLPWVRLRIMKMLNLTVRTNCWLFLFLLSSFRAQSKVPKVPNSSKQPM